MQLSQHRGGPACHDTSWPIFYLKIGNSCEMEGGFIEAPWHFKLNELGPFVVDMDCEGNNLFDEIEAAVHENRKKVYEQIGIPADFEYTKLYSENG